MATPLRDPVPDPAPAELPRALLVSLMQAAERAVATVNNGLLIQFTQPVQPPLDAETFLQQLVLTASSPVLGLWDAIEPADLRLAGKHLAFAFLRELATTGASGLAKVRQFANPAPPPESPSPAPGSAP